MKWLKRVAVLVVLVIIGAAIFVFGVMPARVGSDMNEVRVAPPYTVSGDTASLHQGLFVADLHADSLLWCRDLARKGTWGHLDIPRMREGNMAIQAFTAVTKSPEGQNIHENAADAPDKITQLVIAQRWPVRTWGSLKERALYQAARLQRLVDSDDQLRLLRTKSDVATFVADRADDSQLVGAFLGIEGLHCLEGNLENLDELYDAGYRMAGPTHFFDNALGGSAHGESNAGLSDFGKQVIAVMDARSMVIDLAHASSAMIDDILAMTDRPVLVSHTGVRGTCDNPRNLSDTHIDAIAAGDGLIGIGLWKTAVCGTDAAATVAAMKYVADRVGVAHVALGSDFDGATTAPFDVTGLPLITEALMEAGFGEEDIARMMGGNVREFLLANLPD